ncbi:hypothetical protein EFY79_11050 [Hanamia caeni]|uniref:Uncharacterized protein n=1 Tax=Hanamia caeni TaxID=2294116 RepID=A0A3M9NF28_9BACT|nr:hypothetical protein EFY79_11050 [Hanamia caeni]
MQKLKKKYSNNEISRRCKFCSRKRFC